MISPEQRVSMHQSETQRLQEFLGTLAREDWQRSSPCDQWTVADVVAHLTIQDQDYLVRIGRALHGDISPPEGTIPPEANAQRAIALRKRLGDDLLPTFVAAHRALHALLVTIGPEDWDRPCYRPRRSESIQSTLDALINDRTVHSWDIQSTFAPHARLSLECVPVVVERIAHRLLLRRGQPETAREEHALRYRFDITGMMQYRTDVVLTATQQYMEAAGHDPVDGTFRCDGETFILLMYGRILAHEAVFQGKMTFEGDTDLVVAFSQRFKGG